MQKTFLTYDEQNNLYVLSGPGIMFIEKSPDEILKDLSQLHEPFASDFTKKYIEEVINESKRGYKADRR